MQDNEQDKDNKALTELYAELGREQPSAALDEKILNQAHKAVESVQSTGPFSATWLVPVSMAAVIVLSVMLVTLVDNEQANIRTDISQSAGTLKEDAGIRQSLELAKTESLSSIAQNKSGPGDSVANKTQSAADPVVLDRSASIAEKAVKPPAQVVKRENKKQAVAAARLVEPSRKDNQSVVIAEQEASTQVFTDKLEESRIARSIQPAYEDTPEASQARQFADKIASSSARLEPGISHDQAVQEEGEVRAMQPAPLAKGLVKEKNFKELADKAAGNRGESACKQLNELECLKSPLCTLHQAEKHGNYYCRLADNNCEVGFIQLNHQKSDCEAKSGCSFFPADCYCAPKQNCQCRNGVPASCTPIHK